MTVGELLPGTMDGLKGVVKLGFDDEDAKQQPALVWKSLEPQVTDAIRGALDVDVFTCAAQAWCKARELHEYASGGSHRPEERAVVFLGEHAFTWEAHPTFTIVVGTFSYGPCRLTLTLTGQIEGAELLIHDGHIEELRSGECLATAQLSYKDVPLHHALATRKVPLPGRHRFAAPGLKLC